MIAVFGRKMAGRIVPCKMKMKMEALSGGRGHLLFAMVLASIAAQMSHAQGNIEASGVWAQDHKILLFTQITSQPQCRFYVPPGMAALFVSTDAGRTWMRRGPWLEGYKFTFLYEKDGRVLDHWRTYRRRPERGSVYLCAYGDRRQLAIAPNLRRADDYKTDCLGEQRRADCLDCGDCPQPADGRSCLHSSQPRCRQDLERAWTCPRAQSCGGSGISTYHKTYGDIVSCYQFAAVAVSSCKAGTVKALSGRPFRGFPDGVVRRRTRKRDFFPPIRML
jgi:hypothetical protein